MPPGLARHGGRSAWRRTSPSRSSSSASSTRSQVRPTTTGSFSSATTTRRPRSGELRTVAASDSRIALSASPTRLGFYGNFERALAMVPAGAEWVALSDQDDRWYADKLEALLSGIGDAQLAYSDMRIVDPEVGVIAPSFWMSRRNNYENLGSLLLANTVTGAASLFRRLALGPGAAVPTRPRRALSRSLDRLGRAGERHDQLHRPSSSGLRPARDAALGHASAMRGYRPRRVVRLSEPRESMDRVAEHGRRTYVTNSCRLALQAQVLEERVGDRATPAKLRAIRRVGRLAGPREPLRWLALRAARPPWSGRNETAGIELSLLSAAASAPCGAPAGKVSGKIQVGRVQTTSRRCTTITSGTCTASSPIAWRPARRPRT